MGTIRIVLVAPPGSLPDYTQLDAALERMGYQRRVPTEVDGAERWFLLPVGSYWHEEPVELWRMLDDARTALYAADELGAQIVATAGPSA